MQWIEVLTFTLNPSIMCAGEPDFTPYMPYLLKNGLLKGKYKIQYVSGAVRSHNVHLHKTYIDSYNLKWNKYYTFLDNAIILDDFDTSFFPLLKFNVFQCLYGTLPGFTRAGTNTKKLAEMHALNDRIPDDIYNSIKDDILPLIFEVDTVSPICFWYTDKCAPCVEGSITYKLYKELENLNILVNGLSLISFDIDSLKVNNPLYYSYTYEHNKTLSDKPYELQQNLIKYLHNKDYIKNLKSYNTVGFNLNNISNSNLYKTYLKDTIIKNDDDVFWKITKKKLTSSYNLITKVNNGDDIPLFANVYTVLPASGSLISGSIINFDSGLTFYLNGSTLRTFTVPDTSLIKFNTSAYLYKGVVKLSDFITRSIIEEEDLTIVNTNEILKNNIINILLNNNLINSDFYIYIADTFIQIISQLEQTRLLSEEQIYGPFNTILAAVQKIKLFCLLNSYLYLEITLTYFAIGKRDV